MRRRRRWCAACVAAQVLLAGKEHHLTRLQAGILIEECGKSTGDGGGVGAIVPEGLGGNEDQPGVGLARGLYRASRGMKSLMLAVTRARPMAVA